MAAVTLTPGLLTLQQAITTQENAPAYLNNPCALVYAGQPGASQSGLPNNLAQFDSIDDGETACDAQLGLYASGTCAACDGQPLTLDQMTAIYCPASVPGCDPETYANNLANALGVTPDTLVSDAIAGTGSTDQTGLSDLGIFGGQTVTVAGVELPLVGIYAGIGIALLALWLAVR